jgi:hypothetical protein
MSKWVPYPWFHSLVEMIDLLSEGNVWSHQTNASPSRRPNRTSPSNLYVRPSPTIPFYCTKIYVAVNLGILHQVYPRSSLFYVAIRWQSHNRDRAARSCVEMDVDVKSVIHAGLSVFCVGKSRCLLRKPVLVHSIHLSNRLFTS